MIIHKHLLKLEIGHLQSPIFNALKRAHAIGFFGGTRHRYVFWLSLIEVGLQMEVGKQPPRRQRRSKNSVVENGRCDGMVVDPKGTMIQ
jgi:hypothetical protein